MADSYILFRQGKTPIGPFITIEAATNYIVNKRLLGFAVLPMNRPEISGVMGQGQSVVGSGRPPMPRESERVSLSRFMDHERGQFHWRDEASDNDNLMAFITEVTTAHPKIGHMKIALIKSIRILAKDYGGFNISLVDARAIVESHSAVFDGSNSNGETK